MRVTLHLTTGENLDIDTNETGAEALDAAIARSDPWSVTAPVWRRKNSTTTSTVVTVATAHIVYALRHRSTSSTAVDA
jgi:hypothetical protein